MFWQRGKNFKPSSLWPTSHPLRMGEWAGGGRKELHSSARFNARFKIQIIMQNKGLPRARQIVFIWKPRPDLDLAASSWWLLVAFSRLDLSPLPSPAHLLRLCPEGTPPPESYPVLSAAFSRWRLYSPASVRSAFSSALSAAEGPLGLVLLQLHSLTEPSPGVQPL